MKEGRVSAPCLLFAFSQENIYFFASELQSQNKEDKLQNKENKKSAESRSIRLKCLRGQGKIRKITRTIEENSAVF